MLNGIVILASKRKKAFLAIFSSLMLLLLTFAVIHLAEANQPTCGDSIKPGGGGYTVTTCFVAPNVGITASGEITVTATITVTGNDPGVQRVLFYKDGEYLLTHYENPYTYLLPTDHFQDGIISLGVAALMRDGFWTNQTVLTLTLDNGNVIPPINNKSFTPYTSTVPAGQSYVVATVGDGASGETPEVPDLIASLNPDMFIYTGDVYDKGTFTEFYNWYGNAGTYFHQFYNITNPVIGNHEYEDGVAPGYFFYWDNIPNYYSFDSGGWHFIMLNSTSQFDEYEYPSSQYIWLEQELQSSPPCTIVTFHHPRYSVGPQGNKDDMQAMWQLMADYDVDIALTGHDHSYQRWLPMDGSGTVDPNGVIQFVSGAGGHGVQSFVTTDSRMVAGADNSPTGYGALRLKLNPIGAEFAYINIFDQILDSGVIPCTGAPTDTTAPTAPVLSGNLNSLDQASLNWTTSYDDTGVESYTIYRDGIVIATVDGAITSFVDLSANLQTMYSYEVDAVDLAGNHSAKSNLISLTTEQTMTIHYMSVADSYIHQSYASSNYGDDDILRTDGSPDQRAYLRFDAFGLHAPVSQVTFNVYANSYSSTGFDLHKVDDNSWQEMSITYNNAPPFGSWLANSANFAADYWVSLDVSSVITQDGMISFGISSSSSTSISYSSKEGSFSPYLAVTLSAYCGSPDIQIAQLGADNVQFNWSAGISDIYRAVDDPYFTAGTLIGDDVASGFTYSEPLLGDPANNVYYTVGGSASCGKRVGEFDFGILPGSSGGGPTPTPTPSPTASDTPTATPNYTPTPSNTPTSTPVYTATPTNTPTATNTPTSTPTPTPTFAGTTWLPIADAYVNAFKPTRNYGNMSKLTVDASPVMNAYLKFDVQTVAGTPTGATLRLYANSSSTAGVHLYQVTDNSWTELGIVYNNAPALGSFIADSTGFVTGSWVDIDVSSVVTGVGTYSFVITSDESSPTSFASREAANAPMLIVHD